MIACRRLLAQRHFAMLICMAALLLKLLVPAGYMIASERGHIIVTICSGVAPRTMAIDIQAVDSDAHEHGGSEKNDDQHDGAEMPCAFSVLSAQAIDAMDSVLLGALIAFIMAAGVGVIILRASYPPAYLRPPLRGPPAYL